MVLKITNQLTVPCQPKDDKLASLIGHFGKWQLLVFATIFLVKFSSGWVQMMFLFLTPKVTFWCDSFDSNVTKFGLNNTCYDDCLKYSYDNSPMKTSITSEWDLICERQWMASFTQMVLQLGVLIGSIIFGFLSDRYGRKSTFLTSVVLVIVVGFATPYAPSYAIFTVLRFLLGIATSGTMVISFVIVMEAIGPKYRELLGCLFHIPFILGHLTIPVFAYYFRTWDSYTLALAVPALVYLGYFFTLSESPRWLVSVGRVEEATKIVAYAAEMNNLPTEKIPETLKQLSADIVQNKSAEPRLNYTHLVLTPVILKRTATLVLLWLIAGFTFFGLNQYISQTSPDPFISVAAAGAIQIPSNFLSIWLMRRFGRKTTTSLSFCLGGLVILTLGCVPKIFHLTLILGTLGVSCGAIFSTTIYIYSSELFPTVTRNMGMGVGSMAMRIGSMVAPFVASLSLTVAWLPTVIFGCAPLAAGLLCLVLPETKNKKLPDSIEDVESSE